MSFQSSGVPTDFDDPLVCANCTMCCNVQGGCHTTYQPLVNELTFKAFLGVILGFISGLLTVGTIFKCFVYNRYFSSRQEATREKINEEKKSALKTIGTGSVYCFFLTKSLLGWIIALLVITFQFYVFLYFVKAAEKGECLNH